MGSSTKWYACQTQSLRGRLTEHDQVEFPPDRSAARAWVIRWPFRVWGSSLRRQASEQLESLRRIIAYFGRTHEHEERVIDAQWRLLADVVLRVMRDDSVAQDRRLERVIAGAQEFLSVSLTSCMVLGTPLC